MSDKKVYIFTRDYDDEGRLYKKGCIAKLKNDYVFDKESNELIFALHSSYGESFGRAISINDIPKESKETHLDEEQKLWFLAGYTYRLAEELKNQDLECFRNSSIKDIMTRLTKNLK